MNKLKHLRCTECSSAHGSWVLFPAVWPRSSRAYLCYHRTPWLSDYPENIDDYIPLPVYVEVNQETGRCKDCS